MCRSKHVKILNQGCPHFNCNKASYKERETEGTEKKEEK